MVSNSMNGWKTMSQKRSEGNAACCSVMTKRVGMGMVGGRSKREEIYVCI